MSKISKDVKKELEEQKSKTNDSKLKKAIEKKLEYVNKPFQK